MYQSMKQIVKRVLEERDYIDEVNFVYCDPETIRYEIDCSYTGKGKEVLVVHYNPDLYACPAYVVCWEWIRPDELANQLEI